MKKLSKKIVAVLLCAWNLYLPNHISEQDEYTVNNPIVEEIPDIIDEIDEDIDEDERKGGIKKVFYFIPTLLFSTFKAIVSFVTGILVLNPITILIFILLVLAALLLMNKKYWGAILGIIAGCIFIQQAINQVEIIIGEVAVGIIIIIIHIVLGFVVYKKGKEIKEQIVEKIKIKGIKEDYEI